MIFWMYLYFIDNKSAQTNFPHHLPPKKKKKEIIA